ncbi:hypothetical protein D3C80_1869180 [compost metagenome]
MLFTVHGQFVKIGKWNSKLTAHTSCFHFAMMSFAHSSINAQENFLVSEQLWPCLNGKYIVERHVHSELNTTSVVLSWSKVWRKQDSLAINGWE